MTQAGAENKEVRTIECYCPHCNSRVGKLTVTYSGEQININADYDAAKATARGCQYCGLHAFGHSLARRRVYTAQGVESI